MHLKKIWRVNNIPVITIEGSTLNKEQKKKLVKEITVTASKIMEFPEQAFTIFIKENEKKKYWSSWEITFRVTI